MTGDYRQEPVWGKGDEATLEVINALPLGGYWLDLAAGDGRYVPELLSKADSLIATDINQSALQKIRDHITPEQKSKLEIKVADITETFPFSDASFDGIFCTGTLHLFYENILRSIFSEIDRVLKPGGHLIIDFATDVERRLSDGRIKVFENEPRYSLDQARTLLSNLFQGYDIQMSESLFSDDLTSIPEYGWKTTGSFILLSANKQK